METRKCKNCDELFYPNYESVILCKECYHKENYDLVCDACNEWIENEHYIYLESIDKVFCNIDCLNYYMQEQEEGKNGR